MSSTKITNVEEVKLKLRVESKDFLSFVKQRLESAGRFAEAEARRNAPVDFGDHRKSIVVAPENDGLTQVLSANMTYSPFLEFGTGSGVDVPVGFEDLAMEFKGQGIREVNRVARPHLIPAAKKGFAKFIKDITQGP